MALLEFKNLPDTSTPLNAENLNYNFDLMSNMITIKGSNTSITTGDSEYVEIPYDTNFASVGNKLTFDNTNDCIVIGEGISYVSVSAGMSIQLNTTGMTYQQFAIYKNNTKLDTYAQIRQNSTNTTNVTDFVTLADILIPVQAGDKISTKFFNRLGGSFNIFQQYLSVKVIA